MEDGALEFAARQFDSVEPPLYFLPGNHDIGDNPAAPTGVPIRRSTSRDCPNIAMFWAQTGDHPRRLAAHWTERIFVATADPEEERQFAWLETQLAHGDGALGVLLHKPCFAMGARIVRFMIVMCRGKRGSACFGCWRTRDLRFVVSGHTHQARRLRVGPVEHIWLPSTSFYIPDTLQEPIGAKIVGVGLLDLDQEAGRGTYQFEFVSPAGVARHNLFDHPEVYPVVTALRLKLDGTTDAS